MSELKEALKTTYKYEAVPDYPATATQLLNSNGRSSVCTLKANEKKEQMLLFNFPAELHNVITEGRGVIFKYVYIETHNI